MSHHQDAQRSDASSLQHAAEHERPRRRSPALIYLVILFAAAFLLLLMSYFMQQRNNQEVISGLQRTSHSAVQSLDNLIQENESLKTTVAQQKDTINQQKTELSAANLKTGQLEQENETMRRQLEALDWFWRIQRYYSRGNYRTAREMIAAFEDSGLVSALPTTSTAEADGLSPAMQYQAILDALN